MRKPLRRRPVRRQHKPLLPPTTFDDCGARCFGVTLHYPDQPFTLTLHNVGPWGKLGIVMLVTALSLP